MYRRTAQLIRHKWTYALRLARQWLAERVEDFPIPVEDVIWIERAGHSVATDGRLISGSPGLSAAKPGRSTTRQPWTPYASSHQAAGRS